MTHTMAESANTGSSAKPAASASTDGVAANMGKLASAAAIANPFQGAIADAIAMRRQEGKKIPKLIGILATPSPPSVAYAQWTKKACEQVGIEFEIWQTWSEPEEGEGEAMEGVEQERPNSDLEADVEDLIMAANSDDSINGIMVYYPIFGGRQDTYLQQIVDPRKDVEGLHFSYCFNMYHNIRWISPAQLGGAPGTTIEASSGSADSEDSIPPGYAKSILPCTPLAVVKCLESLGAYDRSLPYGDRLFGKTITVVNRSEVVGRPLAALLSNDGAKVYSVDLDSVQEFNKRAPQDSERKPSKTVMMARERNASHRLRPSHVVRPCQMTLQECIAASDIVISGVPAASFKIETDWIKPGTVTVNFSSEKNFEKDVRTRASTHLPAIGKTTIAMLQRNLLRLVEYRELTESQAAASTSNGAGGSGPAPPSGGASGSADEKKGGSANGKPDNQSADKSKQNGPSSQKPNGSSHQPGARDAELNPNPTSGEHSHQAVKQVDMTYDVDGQVAQGPSPPKLQRDLPPSQRFGPNTTTNLMRDRAHNTAFPRSSLMRERAPHALASPPVPIRRISQPGQTSWDWRNPAGRSDSISSVSYHPGQTPPFGPEQQMNPARSPLLFAPIGNAPGQSTGQGNAAHLYGPGRSGGYGNTGMQSASSPRSSTPVSPLIIDGLSVEDSASSSHIGGGSQRMSWDSGAPRTPHDVYEVPLPSSGLPGAVPSVLGRPSSDRPHVQHPYPHHHVHHHGFRHGSISPSDEKMALDNDPRRVSMAMPPVFEQTFSRPLGQQGQMTSQPPPANQPGRAITQDRIAHSRRRRRPPYSYSSLIAQAISSSPEGRMTLREIYTWISNAYPDLYSMEGAEGSGWQNTVRHNLSLNKAFIKVARTAQDIYDSCSSGLPSLSQQARGKGGWWMLDPNVNPATIGASTRGDGADEEMDGSRMMRRRRTNSISASIASEEGDLLSPIGAYPPALHPHSGAPSVLQQRGRAYTSASIAGGEGAGGVPSVLRAPRHKSVERAPSQQGESAGMVDHARTITGRTRPRGYTTSSADLPVRSTMSMPTAHPRQALPRLAMGHPQTAPVSPYGSGPSHLAMSPVVHGQNLPPYMASPGAGGPPNLRHAASPAMSVSHALPPAPLTPGQGPSAQLYSSHSPHKRKLRFDSESSLPTANAPPAFYPSNGGEQGMPPMPMRPSIYPTGLPHHTHPGSPSGFKAQTGLPSPHVRPNVSAPSPLGARAVLGPPPPPPPSSSAGLSAKAHALHRQGSVDELARRDAASSAVEREGQGSRMSITGLLNV